VLGEKELRLREGETEGLREKETERDLPASKGPGRVCEGKAEIEVEEMMSNVECNKCKLILLR